MQLTHKKKLLLFKIIAVLLFVVLSFNLRTHYKVPDIDMRILVSALGIDKTEDDKIRASAHILIPVAAAGSKSISEFAEAEGETVSEAINRLNIVTGSKIEVLQCSMIVLGEKLCEDGALKHVKSLHSAGQVKAGVFLIASHGMDASEYLKAEIKTADEPVNRIENFISFIENSLYLPNLTLVKFIANNTTESHSSFMPYIELDTGKEEGGNESAQGQEEKGRGGEEASSDSGKPTMIKDISRLMIFKDGKAVGDLDEDGTRGVAWTQKISKRGFIQIKDFEYNSKSYGAFTGDVRATKSKMKVSFKNGVPHVKFIICADIDLRERYSFNEDLDSGILNEKDFYNAIATEFGNDIKSDMQAAIKAEKDYNADFLQLKYRFARLKSKELKSYQEKEGSDFIKNFTYEIETKVKVR